jgi:DNA-binding winged helix-turn-helix (wHTH) protein/tetratricopeptide (TPR) repeat protein
MHIETPHARSFRFGLFEADVAQKTLTRTGVRIKIQDQPFRVLLILLDRPGEIVSREELRAQLWPDGTFVDFDGSLNVILKKLRAALDDNPENPRFIQTVPRHGYRFIAPVVATPEQPAQLPAPAQPIPPAAINIQSPPPAQIRPHLASVLFYAAVTVLLVASAAVGWRQWTHVRSTAIASSTSSPARIHLRRSLAVLGFQNLSASPSDSWLGTAISEMLSTELAGGDELRLVSAEDVANLRAYSPWVKADTLNKATTLRIHSALDADLIVLGSYTRIGTPPHARLRIDVRLQDTNSGEVLSEIAEIGGADDLFGIVSRAGEKLRDKLGVSRTRDANELLAETSLPSNPEAARFYSLGLEKLRANDFPLAHGLFEQAVAADPKFPFSHAMLSRADLFTGHFDTARAEAKRGLDLSAGLSREQRMQIEASYDEANGERAKAADIYRVLFDLYPDNLDYGLQLAKLQRDSYHPDESMATVRRLRQLPPPLRDDPLIDIREGILMMASDLGAAEKLYRSAAQKAIAQDRRQVYARAEQSLCYLNPKHLQDAPECREAYNIFSAAGNQDFAGSVLQLMAEHQRLTGHPLEAIPLYAKAIQMLKDGGDYEGVGVALNNLSLIYETQGQWARAEDTYKEARKNFAAVNDRINLGIVVANIADIEGARGNFQGADQLYRQAWEIDDAAKPALDQYPHIAHANLLMITGHLDQATSELKPQIDSLHATGVDPWQNANALTGLGDIQRQQGNFNAAQKSYQDAVDLLKSANGSAYNQQVALAQLLIERGHPDQAEHVLRQVIASFEKDRNAGDEFGAYLALCKALLAQRKIPETIASLKQARTLIDVNPFPVFSMPLETLELRAQLAAAPDGKAGHESLRAVQRKLTSLVQRAHQIRFYTAECEARLALGEVETKLSAAFANDHLSAFASEAESRGFILYANQAGRIGPRRSETLAMSTSPR